MSNTKAILEELFLRRKPVKLLMALKFGGPAKYVSALSKETDCTYSHTVKLLEEFRQLNLVSFDKRGRVKLIELTTDGEELAGNFEGVLRKFSKLQKNMKTDIGKQRQIPTPPKTPLPPTGRPKPSMIPR